MRSSTDGSTDSLARLSRRALLATAMTQAASLPARADPQDAAEWTLFRARFVHPDGRVIDTGTHGVSHTEGQGWGMLFAVAFDDRPTFESILAWTTRTLRRPKDALHVWRFDPAKANPTEDRNNATDGDIFIATALARAATRWGVPDYTSMATQIAADIDRLLVRQRGARTILLPGASGFESADRIVANPSYYVFPFIDELAALAPSARWQLVVTDGLQLLADGRFGTWMLSPDWLQIDKAGHVSPAAGWPPRFSFDAVRVPLWLCWRRLPSPALAAPVAFWGSFQGDRPPAWVDVVSGEKAPFPLTQGMNAVAQLAAEAPHGVYPDLPSVAAAPQYYDAALIMLCRLARSDLMQPRAEGP